MLPSVTIISRRHVLVGAGVVLTCFSLPARPSAEAAPNLAPDGFRLLRARSGQVIRDQDAATPRPIWGYEGTVPGPLLRVRRGEELRVRLVNELSAATAIHWHGIRAPNSMDGAPGLTQRAVIPGASFDYRFRPPDAGTFWYHAPWYEDASIATSDTAPEQAGRRRLYGALIVEESEQVAVDREHVLLFDDWLVTPEDLDRTPDKPMQITTNGAAEFELPVRPNERLRLRLINAARARAITLRLDRHPARVMAIDGQPSEPFWARESRVTLGPGNTIDLFADATLEPGASAPILLDGAFGQTPLARLVYERAAPVRPAPLAAPPRLPANPLPARLDFTGARKLDLPIDLRRQPSVSLGEQAARFAVKRGRTVMLALVNRNEFACALHLHGHAFRLLDRLDDGWKPFWLATLLVDARQTARIAFLADRAGKWLIEGQAIDHPEFVMAEWFAVE
jgi:FtsP/CotA-like multicopper oxidase with cupredoxin domain